MDSMISTAGGLLDWAQSQSGLPNMVFFHEINSFLNDEIQEYADHLLGRVAALVGAVALVLMTLWIMIQGYRITTGQSREPMMALVVNSLKAILIVGLATGVAAGAGSLYSTLGDGIPKVINSVMTGDEDGAGTYEDIDRTLAIMQVALEVIDSVDAEDSVMTDDRKERAMWFAGVGLGGPAIMAGTMLLLNKIALAMILGLGPIFILCLLFEPTKQLFNKWLFYGIGTLFSLALLSVIVTLAMDMVIAVGMAFWVSSWITPGGGQEGLTSMSMQQGGLGLILTMLIVSTPPMAAMFFQGVLGNFTPYSAFNQGQGAVVPPGQPGAGTPIPASTPKGSAAFTDHAPQQAHGGQVQTPSITQPGQRGLAT